MSLIKNKEELAISELRKDALGILEAGLEAIDTKKILKSRIVLEEGGALCIEDTGYQCNFYERIFFVGIGKCALEGAGVIEDILGEYLTAGIALDVKSGKLNKIKSLVGTHPYPSEQNVSATKEILEMIKGMTERDLVLVLLSGGGSALFELPIPGISLEDIIEKTKKLTAEGASIYELNAARKEMSQVKGGKFAQFLFPAQVVSLIFSDVLGNDISIIASGPTLAEGVKNILVCSNRNALFAMKEKAKSLGFDTTIETETLSGNASEVGKMLAEKELKPKTCLLFGGETIVKVKGNGKGGRNQEMALSALSQMEVGSMLVCAASDGWDNTEHAGAIADRQILEKAKSLGLDLNEFLERNDSFNFFDKAGGALYTGRLGSNVSDLVILIRSNE